MKLPTPRCSRAEALTEAEFMLPLLPYEVSGDDKLRRISCELKKEKNPPKLSMEQHRLFTSLCSRLDVSFCCLFCFVPFSHYNDPLPFSSTYRFMSLCGEPSPALPRCSDSVVCWSHGRSEGCRAGLKVCIRQLQARCAAQGWVPAQFFGEKSCFWTSRSHCLQVDSPSAQQNSVCLPGRH